jgi:hypothetical protein
MSLAHGLVSPCRAGLCAMGSTATAGLTFGPFRYSITGCVLGFILSFPPLDSLHLKQSLARHFSRYFLIGGAFPMRSTLCLPSLETATESSSQRP